MRCAGKDLEAFLQIALGDRQRREAFDHLAMSAAGLDNEPALEAPAHDFVRYLPRPHVEPQHHASPFHVRDLAVVPAGNGLEPVLENLTLPKDGLFECVITPEGLERSLCGYEGMAVATERAAVLAALPDVHVAAQEGQGHGQPV